MNHSLSRRKFLQSSLHSGAGLVVACQLPMLGGCATRLPHHKETAWEPNAWLQITPENEVIFYLHRTEMGQGILTGLTTMIAEELNTPPPQITVHTSGLHPDYINPVYGVQVTGGSTSTQTSWLPLRLAAATTRDMLIAAAATRWGVSGNDCQAKNKQIYLADSHFTFGELASDAANLTPPEKPRLTPPENFRYIGKYNQRLDAKMKVTGSATFGIDAGIPFAYRAALLRCPVRGGTIKSYDPEAAMAMPGILKVVAIDNGIAVISQSYWQAKQALQKLTVNWQYPKLQAKSSDDLRSDYLQQLANEQGKQARKDGVGAEGLKDASLQLEANYEAPYLAHATMEPMNCTVVLNEDSCEVWAPTQGPDVVAALVEEVTGLRRSQIRVHTTLMGGGFGRRLNQDFAVEAAQIAKASGMPIQLIWSREDDTQNDFYRPAAFAELKAGLTADGTINTWSFRSTSTNIMAYTFQEMVGAVLPAWLPDGLVRATGSLGPTLYGGMMMDHTSVEGAQEYHYDTPNVEVRHIHYDPGLPVGFLRSVGHSFNGFFLESFMDELADAANQDPVEFRLKHLQGNPRLKKTLQVLADKGAWGKPSQPNYFQGIAAHPSFNSYVSQLAEISIENNQIQVHRVICVIDCGQVINPDIVTMQMESGIIFGMTAALFGEITLNNGEVEQNNFDSYPLLRMGQSPDIEVYIIPSENAPTGVGEPGVPPIAPAIANAVFRATGRRLRKLPLSLTNS